MRGDLVARSHRVRERILQWIGVPCGIGIGATKTLAKLANHVAKMADRKPGSYPRRLAQVCDFATLSRQALDELMRRTDVGDVWGIGRKTAPKLLDAGIRSVLDLRRADATALGRQLGIVMEKTVRELQGTPCLEVDDDPPARQQILCSRSFGSPVTELPELIEVVSGFATRVARRLRAQQGACNAVQVFIATSPWRKEDRQHAPTATLRLRRPTSDTRALVNAAVMALRGIYRAGYRYAKAGVTLVELQSDKREPSSLELFEEPEAVLQPDGRRDLMATLDALNDRFGLDAVSIASSAKRSRGVGSANASRQERRSPRYTTRLEEVVVVRA